MPSGADRAYLTGLKLLGRRELTEVQLRVRLTRRQFDADDVEDAIVRLRGERALDDQRTALAFARTALRIRHRGRLRVLRELEAIGIPRPVARSAVDEVFGEVDENAEIDHAIARRNRDSLSYDDPAVVRRLYRYLLIQGFDASRVAAALRRRTRGGVSIEE